MKRQGRCPTNFSSFSNIVTSPRFKTISRTFAVKTLAFPTIWNNSANVEREKERERGGGRIRRHQFVESTQSTKWSMQKGSWKALLAMSTAARRGEERRGVETIRQEDRYPLFATEGKTAIRHSHSPDRNFDRAGSSFSLNWKPDNPV